MKWHYSHFHIYIKRGAEKFNYPPNVCNSTARNLVPTPLLITHRLSCTSTAVLTESCTHSIKKTESPTYLQRSPTELKST